MIEAWYRDPKIGIDDVAIRLSTWLRQNGYNTLQNLQDEWRVITVTKGAGLWKGELTIYLYPRDQYIYLRIDTGDMGMAYLKGGFIGMSMQNDVNNLINSIVNSVAIISGATRVR